MSLIFLDTPQISLLESVRRSDAVRYRSFVDHWRQRDCMLVFTEAQASELRRYSNESRRHARYEVLADLAPIRTDIPTSQLEFPAPRTLTEREIMLSMVERNLIRGACPETNDLYRRWAEILPGRLTSGVAAWLRSLYENPIMSDLIFDIYGASCYAAQADRRHTSSSKENRRLKDVSNEPLSEDQTRAYKAEIEKQRALRDEGTAANRLPPVPSSAWETFVEPVLDEFLGRAEEAGRRQALLEHLNIVGISKEDAQKRSIEELISEHVFQFQVRRFARELLGAAPEEEEFIVRSVSLTQCPGSWLELRLKACIPHRVENPEPNHRYDAERLSYLPYVDLLLTDAEMTELVRQIMREESAPLRVREARPPTCLPHSIAALESAIDSLWP